MKPIYVKEKSRELKDDLNLLTFEVQFDNSDSLETLIIKGKTNEQPSYQLGAEAEILCERGSWVDILLQSLNNNAPFSEENLREFQLIEEGAEYCYIQKQPSNMVQVEPEQDGQQDKEQIKDLYSMKPTLVKEMERWINKSGAYLSWFQVEFDSLPGVSHKVLIESKEGYAVAPFVYSIGKGPDVNCAENSWVVALMKTVSEACAFDKAQPKKFKLNQEEAYIQAFDTVIDPTLKPLSIKTGGRSIRNGHEVILFEVQFDETKPYQTLYLQTEDNYSKALSYSIDDSAVEACAEDSWVHVLLKAANEHISSRYQLEFKLRTNEDSYSYELTEQAQKSQLEELNQQQAKKPGFKQISMLILSGFIAVVGVPVIALALILFKMAKLVFSAVGEAAHLLKGLGLFGGKKPESIQPPFPAVPEEEDLLEEEILAISASV